jgi:nitronate monooxygenase
MIDTPLTRMLKIDYPIICAPMFLVSYEELTIAVSEAGGLGTFPLPNYRTLDELKDALSAIRGATQKPIGVNIHLHGRFPWKDQLAICLDAGVSFFITSLGDPRLIIDDVHKNGGKVFADVISLKQGLKACDRGIDGLVAVATGAGGHGGTVPTMVLVPYLRAKTGLPIIAAGGISNGQQMAAAIGIGACGVISGTRFILAHEAKTKPGYKDAVIQSGPEDIVVSDILTGNPASWIAKSIEGIGSGPDLTSKKWLDYWSAGQSVAQAESEKPASEIIKEMVMDYEKTLKMLNSTVSSKM